MKFVTYKLSLKGLKVPPGAISFSALRRVLEALYEGSERALRLAIEGESVKAGRLPDWLEKSADFVLKGIKKGSTVLVFDAPTLGEVAPKQIQQQDLWYTVPEPDDTALTMLAKAVEDIKRENRESERYDPGVLESLLSLRELVKDDKVTVGLTCLPRRPEKFFLNKQSFEKIEVLKKATPLPQAVIVTGYLDAIRHSRQQFELKTERGEIVRGRIDAASISVEQMRELWGKKVTVKGVLHFMASGKPRFLEAQVINPRETGDEIFSTFSLPLSTHKVMEPLKEMSSREGLVSEIWGQWPGDERIEELLDDLEDSPEA